ncbi:MAG: S8 family serine peptidase, partial [Pseudomonadota bacterium]
LALTPPGEGTRVYMVERDGCIDEDTHYISNYLDVRGSSSDLTFSEHAIKTTGVFHAVSPKAFIHCAGGGFSLPQPAIILPFWPPIILPSPNPPSSYDAVSVSMSQGLFGNYGPWDRTWDDFVYNHDVPIFQAAGNKGNTDQFVSSPGTAYNVITVGNYAHKTGTDAIYFNSGWKDGETGIEKPEIVAPGTDLDIRGISPPTFFGRNGTSYSTPHAAGFYLNFIGDEPWFSGSAALAKAYMVSHASIPVAGGADKVGEGGIFYRKAGGTIYWWNEPNSAWNSLKNDGNYLTLPVAVNWSRDKATVAIAWLTRGSYTYQHKDDVHPLGMDFDMRVIDASGNYVCGSASWDNTYESCTWTLPDVATSYRVRVNRKANRDTASRIKLAIVSHSFND